MSFLLSECNLDKEKISIYECGFDPFHSLGETFYLGFFIAILFLVFDLEISYLFPYSVCYHFSYRPCRLCGSFRRTASFVEHLPNKKNLL